MPNVCPVVASATYINPHLFSATMSVCSHEAGLNTAGEAPKSASPSPASTSCGQPSGWNLAATVRLGYSLTMDSP